MQVAKPHAAGVFEISHVHSTSVLARFFGLELPTVVFFAGPSNPRAGCSQLTVSSGVLQHAQVTGSTGCRSTCSHAPTRTLLALSAVQEKGLHAGASAGIVDAPLRVGKAPVLGWVSNALGCLAQP